MLKLCELASAGSKGKLPTGDVRRSRAAPVGSDPARIVEADSGWRDPLTGFPAAFSLRAEKIFGGFPWVF